MPFFPTDIENKSLLPVGAEERVGDYIQPLSLDKLLVTNAPATFFASVAGSERDIVVIDKSATVEHNSLVVLFIDGEFVVRRIIIAEDGSMMLSITDGKATPLPENTAIWGRVTYYIKAY